MVPRGYSVSSTALIFREILKDGVRVPLHAACPRAAEVLDELYREIEPTTLTVSSKQMAVNR